MYKIYEINDGDTLDSVAFKLGVSPEVLASLNGLSVNATLNPDSFIIVPNSDNNFDKYTIKKGDTIYQIASSYNISPSQLLKLNGLNDSDIIYPGEDIMIPRENVQFYVTIEGDTVNGLTQFLRAPIDEIARQNDTIYLMPDQLIVYKR